MYDRIMSEYEAQTYAVKSKIPKRVSVEFFLGQVPPNVKKRVRVALQKGFIMAWSGETYEVFSLLIKHFDIPGVRVRREQTSKYYPIAPWRFDWREKWEVTPKLQELFTADEVAIRMIDDDKTKQSIKHQSGGLWSKTLFMLKDPKMLEEALEERMQGHEEKIRAAIEALDNGAVLRITH